MIASRGPQPAKYLIVGESPSAADRKDNACFSGTAGFDLHKLIIAAGIDPASCRYTYVHPFPVMGNPKEILFRSSKKQGLLAGAHFVNNRWVMPTVLESIKLLEQEIRKTKPEVVIGCGELPLWALAGEKSITNWRGSQLIGKLNNLRFKFLPTYAPSIIAKKYEWNWVAQEDFKRAARPWQEPAYDFLVCPTFTDVSDYCRSLLADLDQHIIRISSDIETRQGQIACMGLARNSLSAICIPILVSDNPAGFWTPEEEHQIVRWMRAIHTHPNAHIIGQNFNYDRQYFAKLWGFKSNCNDDTMIKHHTLFPGTQKGLDFLSSIYCGFHRYWKNESKDWDPRVGEEQLWVYNCKDAVATFEINEELDELVPAFEKTVQYQFQMQTSHTAFNMMLRGVNVNLEKRQIISEDLGAELNNIRTFLEYVLQGFRLFGPKGISSPQMMKLAYDIFDLPKKYKLVEGKRRLTAAKEAIEEWCDSVEPIFRPVLRAIRDYRSLTIYKSTFADAPLDADNRFRCSISIAGPETFRWATSEDAFGFGTNLQNIPRNQS